ncbi:GH13394 [Drosophila grimshawi]|uniref:GH13394 n=1 Tax=Drosophila grimshawi TaxID=7222 RepID=B4JPI5_DROGR|nr:GH13394 [Drosophila grimshawi]
MRPSCIALNGTHKFRANCCTKNEFAASSKQQAPSNQQPVPSFHCHGHIHIPRSPNVASLLAAGCWLLVAGCICPMRRSSSSLLQFCLNYFACLFMVESLILQPSVADNLDVDVEVAASFNTAQLSFCSCRMRGHDLDNALPHEN